MLTTDNSFGTHEFLDLCELLGTDTYLAVNVGSGTPHEAMQWVEYITRSDTIKLYIKYEELCNWC